MARAVFGTAINCIDGRVQIPVIAWMREVLSLDYVDLITEPGADGVFAQRPDAAEQVIRPKVSLSVLRHASPVVAIAAHHDCLANPVDEDQHRHNLKQAVTLVRSWHPDVKVVALWVGESWRVDVVQTRGATR